MKKELYFPVAAVFIGTAFFIISLLVTLTKGKNPYLIKRKLRLGGMLLYFTAIGTGCDLPRGSSCYDPEPENRFLLGKTYEWDTVEINLNDSTRLSGNIFNRTKDVYSYGIFKTDSLNKDLILQKGEILPLDGKFDSSTEKFELQLSPDLDSGLYSLRFFLHESSKIDSIDYSYTKFTLKILK